MRYLARTSLRKYSRKMRYTGNPASLPNTGCPDAVPFTLREMLNSCAPVFCTSQTRHPKLLPPTILLRHFAGTNDVFQIRDATGEYARRDRVSLRAIETAGSTHGCQPQRHGSSDNRIPPFIGEDGRYYSQTRSLETRRRVRKCRLRILSSPKREM